MPHLQLDEYGPVLCHGDGLRDGLVSDQFGCDFMSADGDARQDEPAPFAREYPGAKCRQADPGAHERRVGLGVNHGAGNGACRLCRNPSDRKRQGRTEDRQNR